MKKANTTTAWLAQHGPIALFGLLTVTGIVFIASAKLLGWHIYLITAVPVAIMVTYMVVSLVFNGLRLHNEQAGDNLYYMGFLFTLSSLGVSLFRFTGTSSIDEIVRNFGIAVSSTICGIALRILFNQMRRDPLDIERSVRHELAEMTRRVRSELDSSAREFSSYRRTSSQMLLEGFEEIASQAEKTGAAIQSAIETLSRESIKPIQDASTQLAEISEQNLKLFEERSSALNKTSDKTADNLLETSRRIEAMVRGFEASIKTMSDAMANFTPPDEWLKVEMKPAIDALNEIRTQQQKTYDMQSAREERHAKQIEDVLKGLEGLPHLFKAALEPVQHLPQHLTDGLLPIQKAARDIGSSVEALNEKIADLSKSPRTQSEGPFSTSSTREGSQLSLGLGEDVVRKERDDTVLSVDGSTTDLYTVDSVPSQPDTAAPVNPPESRPTAQPTGLKRLMKWR